MSEVSRQIPFHCPYCGETDLWPHLDADAADGTGHGQWECHGCMRAFALTSLGVTRPTTTEAPL
jgi:hypothetical protein